MVILVGSEASVVKMIKNSSKSKRYSGLSQRMKNVREILDGTKDFIV